ncbi:MAG: hypothetical protein Q9164_006867 [Protoblastenia rupestris]
MPSNPFPRRQWECFTEDSDLFHAPYPESVDHLLSTSSSHRDVSITINELTHDDVGSTHASKPKSQKPKEEHQRTDLAVLIERLPVELANEIFGCLSVPTLDAARFTCRTWWTKILSSSAILSKVLDRSANTALRELLAQFDYAAGLAMTHRHPDAWRTRFRVHNVTLQLPQPNRGVDRSWYKFGAVARTPSGNFMLLHVPGPDRDKSDHYSRKQSTVIFYHIDENNIPVYVGYAENPSCAADFKITHVAEIESKRSWIIETGVGWPHKPYVLTVRDGWSRGESPYTVKTMGREDYKREDAPLYRSQAAVTLLSRKTDDNLMDSKDWKLLARLPPSDGGGGPDYIAFPVGYDPYRAELRSQQKRSESARDFLDDVPPSFVAEHRSTGELHVLCGERSDEHYLPYQHPSHSLYTNTAAPTPVKESTYRSVAVLPPPRMGFCFSNVAVSPLVTEASSSIRRSSNERQIVRTAIIWQNMNANLGVRAELFIHEIPTSLLSNTSPATHAPVEVPQVVEEEEAIETSFEVILHPLSSTKIPLPATSQPILPLSTPSIQGKRIISLDSLMGGIHPKSPFRKPSSPSNSAPNSHPYASLGGLAFATRPETPGSWVAQYSKLFVWGPPYNPGAPTTRLNLQIIDLSFADPARLQASSSPPPLTPLRSPPTYHTKTAPWKQSMTGSRMENCACHLHDEAWVAELPDITLAPPPPTLPTPPFNPTTLDLSSLKNLWPFTKRPLPSLTNLNVGTLDKTDSRARQQAFHRRDQWFKRRIVDMKQAGMTDFELSCLWLIYSWTGYGTLMMPDGWREAWKVWAGEKLEIEEGKWV